MHRQRNQIKILLSKSLNKRRVFQVLENTNLLQKKMKRLNNGIQFWAIRQERKLPFLRTTFLMIAMLTVST
jgi:hypothetical protein